MSNEKGWTLIELLIALAVFAIVTTVVSLSMFGFKRKQDLESEKIRISALMNEARARAIASEGGTRFAIRFRNEAGNESYQLVEVALGVSGGCYPPPNSPPAATIIEGHGLKSSVEFVGQAVGTVWDIVFSPLSGVPMPLAGGVSCHGNQTMIQIRGSTDPLDRRAILVNDSGTIIHQ